ncbi:RNA polymerase sigma factor [[Clostridium] fimetarium]|uniref:RNA polymerase sigma-70 factor, ECF subfamily n=1 Tax=[Clostridium] fimetarium TaxID=99656 RepID=A0A1I0Q1K1_9FIRM|nr:RNA polymerase sigma factor [[Clostridium] fimetarium]SEW20838.1 RNA polymerase sigma-70 factor, ECF subfamily [[Clostridium] fimetarium]
MLEIDQIIQDYGRYIYNYALKLTCHPADAEDLAQETFIQAWKNLDGLKSELAIKKWLITICYNQFLMKIRQKSSRIEELSEDFQMLEQEGFMLNDSSSNPVDEVLVEEEIKELQNGCFLAMVRKLTLNQRIVFSLVDMYGMRLEDVAQILGTSILATKGLLFRARMNIDSFFADHCNILNMNNPCSCKAWITFSSNRNNLQLQTKKLIETLNYKEKNYRFDLEVRNKIKFLYSNMPDKKPSEDWYIRVLQSLK